MADEVCSICQMRAVLSALPVATCVLVGCHATDKTAAVCSWKVCSALAVVASHKRAVSSLLPVRISFH